MVAIHPPKDQGPQGVQKHPRANEARAGIAGAETKLPGVLCYQAARHLESRGSVQWKQPGTKAGEGTKEGHLKHAAPAHLSSVGHLSGQKPIYWALGTVLGLCT